MSSIDVEQVDQELLPLMSVDSRTDVRAIAMQYFLGLTGSQEGRQFLSQSAKRLGAIIQLIKVRVMIEHIGHISWMHWKPNLLSRNNNCHLF